MSADLSKLDHEALRAALGQGEAAIARALDLIAGADVSPVRLQEDLGRLLGRIVEVGRAMGTAAEHLDAALRVVGWADAGRPRSCPRVARVPRLGSRRRRLRP